MLARRFPLTELIDDLRKSLKNKKLIKEKNRNMINNINKSSWQKKLSIPEVRSRKHKRRQSFRRD
jgi:hypothetical protein